MAKGDGDDHKAPRQAIWQKDKAVDAAIDELVDSLVHHQAWSSKLGLSRNFIPSILDEPSDWGFALKAAAVGEALVHQLITMHLSGEERQKYYPDGSGSKPPGLKVPIRRNKKITDAFVSSQSGVSDKIALCDHFEWMEASWVACLVALVKVRNRYAHNIRLVNARLTHIIRHEISQHERSDVFDALAHPYGVESRTKLNANLNKGLPVNFNKLSEKRPLEKLESGTIADILKGYEAHGFSHDKINALLRSGALLTLSEIAAVIEFACDEPSDELKN